MPRPIPRWKKAWDRKESRYVHDYEAKHYLWVPERDQTLDRFASLKAIYRPDADRCLDLGAGPGAVALRLLRDAPRMKATLVDGSRIQVQAARARFRQTHHRGRFFLRDLGDPVWRHGVGTDYPLIVSNIAIHHLTDRRKARLFRELHRLLAPNGLFIYCDMIRFDDPVEENIAYDLWNHDIRSKFVEKGLELQPTDWMKQKLIDSIREQGDRPATIEYTLAALRQAGFSQVTLVWFSIKFALFIGVK